MKPKQTESVDPFVADRQMQTYIDTRGLPLTHLVRNNTTEESFLDPKFAPLADDRPGRLRNEIPKFIKANSTDAEVRQVLREAGMEDEAGAPGTVYIRANAEEVPVDVAFGENWTLRMTGERRPSRAQSHVRESEEWATRPRSRHCRATTRRDRSKVGRIEDHLAGPAARAADSLDTEVVHDDCSLLRIWFNPPLFRIVDAGAGQEW